MSTNAEFLAPRASKSITSAPSFGSRVTLPCAPGSSHPGAEGAMRTLLTPSEILWAAMIGLVAYD